MNLLRGWLFYIVLSFSILVLAVCVLCTTPFASVKWRYEAICRPWAKFVLSLLRVICGIAKQPGTITVSVGPVIETKGRDPHEVTAEVEKWIEDELERIDA